MRRAAAAILLAACAALAQQSDEPTPFWMPPPPPKEKKKPPAKKKKPAPQPLPQAEKPKEKKKPAPETPTWIEATPPPEPAPVVRKPVPVAPAPPPARPEPPPQPAPLAAPLPVPARPLVKPPLPPPIAAPPIAETPAPLIAEQEPEPSEPAANIRNWSFDLVAGGWAKSRSDGSGRSWDLAYGLRGSYGLFDDTLEMELLLARAGGTSGSPFVSTSAIHNLAMLRAFWVLGDRFALLLGGGGGVALAQTHYTLTDVASGSTSALDATAAKPVIGITAAGRVRIFGGLQARIEVSGMLRDGRMELLPLLGLGWAL